MKSSAFVVLLALGAFGCRASSPPGGGGRDDAGPPPDGDDAGRTDAGAMLDAGTPVPPVIEPLPRMSDPAPPAEVVRIGSGGLLLRGTVLAPDGPIAGEVLIVGNTITCAAADCSGAPMAGTVTVVDTHATISAGLVDAHNHATYDFLPEWVPDPPRLFDHRYQWVDDAAYEAHVRPEADGRTSGTFVCPATKWAELRSIVHGTTTIEGQSPEQSCVNRLARNADHFHGIGPDHMQTTIAGACESDLGDAARATIVSNFEDGSTTRYAIHMAEGVAGTGKAANVTREYECYAGTFRHDVSLLVDAGGTPFETAMLIHAIALTDAQLADAHMLGAKFVWSPSSNLLLYGRTMNVGRLLELGATVGLGPDWTVSGSDEMLSEMRFGAQWAIVSGVPAVTTPALHAMATSGGADAVGLGTALGRLAPGYRADIAVFGRVAADPYRAVIDSRAADVRLVLIDGLAYYGDLALEPATAVNGDCEMLDACGTPKFLCAANTPGADARATETVEDVRAQLVAYLTTYGRESELLELVDCTL